MTVAIAFLFFIYGLIFGSFYNVVGLRIPKGQSIISPPSHCTVCNRRLTILDLVPVFSYLFLQGKCRGCGTKISFVYPFMELITGILFVLAYLRFGISWEIAVALVFYSLLVVLTVSDLAYMLIPDKFLLAFGIPLIILRMIEPLEPWWDSYVGAILGFSILLLIAIISKGGMGGGDIKLFLVIGIVLGSLNSLVVLGLASVIGLIFGIISLRLTKAGRKTPIPFGPSIAIAAVIVHLYGEELITAYMSLF
ncbi:prepilin peptidase [Chryseomicrobium palamuruense]|uniref:Prepilin peptidase n=1 Tax=Chryseomicrobium palamuruense TaxID=682973 RepID=A0ABV8UZP4_9BACL